MADGWEPPVYQGGPSPMADACNACGACGACGGCGACGPSPLLTVLISGEAMMTFAIHLAPKKQDPQE